MIVFVFGFYEFSFESFGIASGEAFLVTASGMLTGGCPYRMLGGILEGNN